MLLFLLGMFAGGCVVGAPLGYFVYRYRKHLWEHIKESH
jgi:hypothetical protein